MRDQVVPRSAATIRSSTERGCEIVWSISAVTLLSPWVAVAVSPGSFSRPRFVVVGQVDSPDPFGALPEVQVRHQEAGWAAVLRRDRPIVVPVGDTTGHFEQVLERQAGAVRVKGVDVRLSLIHISEPTRRTP